MCHCKIPVVSFLQGKKLLFLENEASSYLIYIIKKFPVIYILQLKLRGIHFETKTLSWQYSENSKPNSNSQSHLICIVSDLCSCRLSSSLSSSIFFKLYLTLYCSIFSLYLITFCCSPAIKYILSVYLLRSDARVVSYRRVLLFPNLTIFYSLRLLMAIGLY